MADIERVNKKGGRHYRSKREKPPITTLIPVAIDALRAMFPSNGDVPSVTTVLGALAKPALIGWAAKEERKMVAAIAGQLYERLFLLVDEPVPKEKFVELLVEEAGKPANRQLLAKAANVGTEVHARIEWEFKGELGLEKPAEPPKLTTVQAVRAFQRWTEWRHQVKLKVVAIEKKIYSSLFGFGGTLDLLAEITVPYEASGDPTKPFLVTRLVVMDFKTGKAVYEESFLQNIAYRMALKEEGIDAVGGWIVRLPKYESDPEFDAVQVPDDPSLATTFIALTVVYRWWGKLHNRKDKPKQVTQPVGVAPDQDIV